MAVKLPSFRLLPSAGTKSRIFIFLLVLAAAAGGVYFLIQYLGSNAPSGSSRIASAPEGVQSVPGGKPSPEFYNALKKANTLASQEAQITGASAVPTLLNVPTAPAAFQQPQQNCTILCPDRTKVDVKSDINDLVKSGKLSRKTADMLLAMTSRNVPVDEYASELDRLVKEGKLTPAEARLLLEKYRKQHRDTLAGKSAVFMDGMIRSGQLSLDEANRLLALQKNGISAGAYSAALKREVKEGRLSEAASAQLLGQYTDQQLKESAAEGAFKLKQLVQQGGITAAVSDTLSDMQSRNAPVSQYAATLKKMVSDGKMTPATAEALLKDYRNQRARTGAADALMQLIHQQEMAAAKCVLDKVGEGGLSRVEADQLVSLQQKGITMKDWQSTLAGLSKEGKFTTAMEQMLLPCYKSLAALREESERLQHLQADNATQGAYADELKHAVQTGLIAPQAAADLMQEYSAMVTPTTTIAATPETAIPGAEEFARLQQRIQQNAGPTTNVGQTQAAQFATAAAEARDKVSEERQQRIQQMQTAMMSQAQTLLTAWQTPTTITHVAGQAEVSKKTGTAGSKALPVAGAAAAGTPQGAAAAVQTPPLIKSGTILFAVLDTAVNSDYPDTPVMATIVQGKYRGAKLLGKLFLAQGQDRVSLSFNLMDSESWMRSRPVSAFAMDPDTARTVMATSVDHHYLMRYGSLFASSFLSGYASAITNAGNSTTGIFGTSTTHPNLSPGNRFAVALGQVGTTLTSTVQGYTNTPATVKIDSGVAVAIMFTADVTES